MGEHHWPRAIELMAIAVRPKEVGMGKKRPKDLWMSLCFPRCCKPALWKAP